jgi:hypothetical protein
MDLTKEQFCYLETVLTRNRFKKGLPARAAVAPGRQRPGAPPTDDLWDQSLSSGFIRKADLDCTVPS